MGGAPLLRIFLPFAAGYFLSYLFRVVNAVLAPDLAADIGVGPSALGLLTSVYFITFASFQLPLGILLDRYGPRKTEAVLLMFAGLGAFIFSQADSLTGLIVGRAFIGFGVSACLMASFKAYAVWFDRSKWPVINGFQMAAGGLGALAATSPVEWLVTITDWRTIFVLLTGLSVLIGVLVFTVVPEKKGPPSHESLTAQLGGIKEVFTSLKFWHVAPLVTLSQAAFLSIQGLWAGPWLRDVIGLERGAAASVLFWMAVTMICGFIGLGNHCRTASQKGNITGGHFCCLYGVVHEHPVPRADYTERLVFYYMVVLRFYRHSGNHCLCRAFTVVRSTSFRPGYHRCQHVGIRGHLCYPVVDWHNHRVMAGGC